MEFRVLTFNRRFIPWVLTTALSCALLLPCNCMCRHVAGLGGAVQFCGDINIVVVLHPTGYCCCDGRSML